MKVIIMTVGMIQKSAKILGFKILDNSGRPSDLPTKCKCDLLGGGECPPVSSSHAAALNSHQTYFIPTSK